MRVVAPTVVPASAAGLRSPVFGRRPLGGRPLAAGPRVPKRLRLSGRSGALGAYFVDIRHLVRRDWEVAPKGGENLPMSSRWVAARPRPVE